MTIIGLWYVILDIFSISGSCPPLIGFKYYQLNCENDVSFNKKSIKRVGKFRRRHLEISWNQEITDHCDVKQ